mmetsp:Transcript_14991/g.28211  ORF Transcript_14991/g.28211 Transcript_14991/m.28211 type:complete len:180 (+) Transcript_14991:371-910(+)
MRVEICRRVMGVVDNASIAPVHIGYDEDCLQHFNAPKSLRDKINMETLIVENAIKKYKVKSDKVCHDDSGIRNSSSNNNSSDEESVYAQGRTSPSYSIQNGERHCGYDDGHEESEDYTSSDDEDDEDSLVQRMMRLQEMGEHNHDDDDEEELNNQFFPNIQIDAQMLNAEQIPRNRQHI